MGFKIKHIVLNIEMKIEILEKHDKEKNDKLDLLWLNIIK
jgi:hypothetical protein